MLGKFLSGSFVRKKAYENGCPQLKRAAVRYFCLERLYLLYALYAVTSTGVAVPKR